MLSGLFGIDKEDWRRAAMMASAAAFKGGRTRGESIANAITGLLGGADQSRQMRMEEAARKLEQERMQLQMDDLRRTVGARKGIVDAYNNANTTTFDAQAFERAAMPSIIALDPNKAVEISRRNQIAEALRGASTQTPFQAAAGGNGAPTVANEQAVQARMQSPQAGTPRMSAFEERKRAADALESRGFVQEAMQMRDQALKFLPKAMGAPQTLIDRQTGAAKTVQMFEDGSSQELPYNPKADVHYVDGGGVQFATDRNTGQLLPNMNLTKTMTHSDRIGAGNLGLARQKFDYEKEKDAIGKIENIEGVGTVRIPLKGDATPVMMGGAPLKNDKGLEEHVSRRLDAAIVMTGANDNYQRAVNTGRVDTANLFAQIQQRYANKPDQPMGAIISNMAANPEAQMALQSAAEWIGRKLRNESGAAISVGEFMKEGSVYFPAIGDDAEVIAQKAARRDAVVKSSMATTSGRAKDIYNDQVKRSRLIDKYPQEPRMNISDMRKELEEERKRGGR